MEKESVIERVRKLLALSQDNFKAEAESALLKAQAILAKYNLTMCDVEDVAEKSDITEEVIEHKNPPWWVFDLAAIIASNFRCEVIRHNFKYQRNKSFRFIGRDTDVKVAIEVMKFATVVIRFNAKSYYSTISANTYITGFLAGLNEKFAEQVERNQWGLVIENG